MAEILKFYVFNVKIQSNIPENQRAEIYSSLIEKLGEKPYKYHQVSKYDAVVLHGALISKGAKEEKLYLYGRASKGLRIEGKEINVLQDGELKKGANDPNEIKNPVVARYLFFPEAHRLFLEKTPNGPTDRDFEKYLNVELSKLIKDDEILDIILEKDDSTIKQIFEAEKVESVRYRISYTNEDFLPELEQAFDAELKASNIGQLGVYAEADNKAEGLKINNSALLAGGIKLAESNGEITRAEIVPANNKGKSIVVSNKNKPKILQIELSDNDNFWDKWYKKVKEIYRNIEPSGE